MQRRAVTGSLYRLPLLTSAERVRSTPCSVVLAGPYFRSYEVVSGVTEVDGYSAEGVLCVDYPAILHSTRRTADLSCI